MSAMPDNPLLCPVCQGNGCVEGEDGFLWVCSECQGSGEKHGVQLEWEVFVADDGERAIRVKGVKTA